MIEESKNSLPIQPDLLFDEKKKLIKDKKLSFSLAPKEKKTSYMSIQENYQIKDEEQQ